MLVDNVVITVQAGKGGNGSVHFRRNAQTAKGGPDGGDGGNGGNVYFQGVDDILGLRNFRFQKSIKAEDGVNGGRQKLFGRNGKDMITKIPLGTLVTNLDTNEEVEITDTEKQILIAKGGVGGRGNDKFKSPTDQAPHYAEKGTPGEIKHLRLELRLIAEIGLIGLPNAGKSSLLQALTNAHPKIGNYPFTTLEPNIGMMHGIPLADIPGLIEGASEGKGLGTAFLRHVQKTKVLLHCIDSTQEDLLNAYKTVRHELEEYNSEMLAKKEIILLTKVDEITPEQLKKALTQLKKIGYTVLTTSIYDDASLDALSKELEKEVNNG